MKILFLGDSITAGGGAGSHEKGYVHLVGKKLGVETVRYGLGGTRIAKQTKTYKDTVYDIDFIVRAGLMEKQADFVFVFGGTNDFGHGDAPIGELDSVDPYTFCGGVNVLIDYLAKTYGKEKLCFITPLHRYDEENTFGEFGDKAKESLTLGGYVEILRKILQKRGIDLLDLYDENFFPKPKTNAPSELTADGIHPNPKGHELLADRICTYLKKKNSTCFRSIDMKKYQFQILDNEHWWGGQIAGAEKMPFDCHSSVTVDLWRGRNTCQSAPLFLSDKGRFIWSDKGFKISFHNGVIDVEAPEEVILDEEESSLRGAFLRAKEKYFPYEGEIRTAREFYSFPQFNTWMELIKEQTQENILAYAKALLENGFKPGILIIDDGWQKEHGTWRFDEGKFSNPKEMIKQLHEMGFKVMLWVSPYISLSSDDFLSLSAPKGIEGGNDHLVRLKDGRVAIHKWWNGYCAMLNFTLQGDCAYMQAQLDTLVYEYGVDGFKFDGGDYTRHPINEVDYYSQLKERGEEVDFMKYGWKEVPLVPDTTDELNMAWIKFGMKYPLHEYKNTWKVGHLPVIQRLYDKRHTWKDEGLDTLIPQGIFLGLIGNPFLCPDMVGGGEWTAFVFGKADEELFVRSAQCSSLFPMIQFSAAPWRLLSKEGTKLCLAAAKIHEDAKDKIIKAVEYAEKTGEPILRSLEYQYPHCGYATINDQFMLGDDILVAPVVEQGATMRKVVFPEGKWKDMTDGKVYEGERVIEVEAPLDKLPYFEKI